MLYYISCFYLAFLSNLFLATFPSFIKWPQMRSSISLFLLSAIASFLIKILRNSELVCRMCHFFLRFPICLEAFYYMLTLTVWFFSWCYFFSLIYIGFFCSIKLALCICLFKLFSLYYLSNFLFITGQLLWSHPLWNI